MSNTAPITKQNEPSYANEDNRQIDRWFNQNYAREGEPLPTTENPVILTPDQQQQVDYYLKEEALRRGEEYVSPFQQPIDPYLEATKQTIQSNNPTPSSELPERINLPHLEPGAFADLIKQYNEETDPNERKALFAHINAIRPMGDHLIPDEQKETVATGTNIEFYVNKNADTIDIDGVAYPVKFRVLQMGDDALNDWMADYNNLTPEQTEERKELFTRIKNRWDNYSVSNHIPYIEPGESKYELNDILISNPNIDPKIIQLIDDQQLYDEDNFPDLTHDLAVKIGIEYKNLRETGDIQHYYNLFELMDKASGGRDPETYDYYYSEKLPQINPNLSPDVKQQLASLMKDFMEEDHDYSKRTAIFDKINELNVAPDPTPNVPRVPTASTTNVPPSRPVAPPVAPPVIEPAVPSSRPVIQPTVGTPNIPNEPVIEPVAPPVPPSRPVIPPNAGQPEIPVPPTIPSAPLNPDHLEPPPIHEVPTAEKLQKQEQKRFSLLSQASYNTYYEDIPTANAKLQQFLPAHTILTEDTTKNSTVIQKINNEGEQEIIIAFRGTDPSNPLDLLADAQIFSGNPLARLNHPTGRFKEAEDTYLRIKAKYPNAKITLTGHSLGGRQALLLGEKYDVPTQVFNVGSSPLDVLFPNAPKRDNIKIYNVGADLISISNAINTNQTVIDTPNRGYAPDFTTAHSLDNFIPDFVLNHANRPRRQKPLSESAPWVRDVLMEPFDITDLLVSKTEFQVFSGFQIPKKIENEFYNPLREFQKHFHPENDKHKDCYDDPITGKRICPHKTDLVKPRANYYNN